MCELGVCFLWAGKKGILKKIWVATKFIFFPAAAQLLISQNISYLKKPTSSGKDKRHQRLSTLKKKSSKCHFWKCPLIFEEVWLGIQAWLRNAQRKHVSKVRRLAQRMRKIVLKTYTRMRLFWRRARKICILSNLTNRHTFGIFARTHVHFWTLSRFNILWSFVPSRTFWFRRTPQKHPPHKTKKRKPIKLFPYSRLLECFFLHSSYTLQC